MTAPLLEVRQLMKRFGAVVASAALDLTIMPGAIHAVIGPNGAGKTTLIGQLAGEVHPDAGRIVFLGREVTHLPVHRRAVMGLARSFQMTSIFPGFSAPDNVALAVQAHRGPSFRFWRPAHTLTHVRRQADAALQRVGLTARASVLAGQLSHGEQRQLEIAMALATTPKLLLLDEPTAGMGPEESARMVALLHSLRGQYTVLLVEHDMEVVFALADCITVLVAGQAIATGSADAIRANVEVRQAYLGEEDMGVRRAAC